MAQLMMQKIVNRCAQVKTRSKDMIMVCAMHYHFNHFAKLLLKLNKECFKFDYELTKSNHAYM